MPGVAAALWGWNTSTPGDPFVQTFRNGSLTKTGVTAKDLRNFARVPIQISSNPIIPIADSELTQWIRESEDFVEQSTSLLLTPTYVASPPALDSTSATTGNVLATSVDGRMRLGIDYDLEDAGYDFNIRAFQDVGWGMQQLRYKPLRNISPVDPTAIKSVAFTYPLLNQHFPVSPTWYVEDRDAAFVRLVPSQNIQTLPLYALQLSIGGFVDTLPGGIAILYTAGLTQADYTSRFAFVKRLVLSLATITALTSIQGTLNNGVEDTAILVDGVQYGSKYSKEGPYGPLLKTFGAMATELMSTTRDMVGGVAMVTL